MQKPNFFRRFYGHFKTICIHKFWVFYYACRLGIPIRGFFHDFSKFHPIEFFEGVRFYTNNTSPINNAKATVGYSMAWMHHKSHNKHHYEYWMDKFDLGGFNLMMPFPYALEEIADYLAAGKAYQKKNFTFQSEYQWWNHRIQQPLKMHPALIEYNTIALKTMAEENRFITKTELYQIYHQCVQKYDQGPDTWTLSAAKVPHPIFYKSKP